ncbi:MAG: acyl-CoA dehydrogenase family protein [Acidimicrobiia bacterium]
MDFERSADQELLFETVSRFLAEQAPISPYVRDRLGDDRGTTARIWEGLGDLGVIGLLAPESQGGAGMGMVDIGVVLEALGRWVHPGPFLASAVGAVSLVTLAGHPRHQDAFLPALASGDQIGTVALWEDGLRARWRAPETTATPDGDGWRLDGTKVHVPDAVGADLVFVIARRPDGGLGAFVVTPEAKGVTITPSPTVDGTRKEATVALASADARSIGDGDITNAISETVDRLGVAMAVDGVGAAARALELAVDYAKERKQFDVPIGSFQAVQHLCADMLRAVELARAAAYYACWACDAADETERHRAATMAQAFADDSLYEVGASAIQVFGGVGFTWEHDIHLFYKRLLSLQQYAGGSIDQLEELATIVLDTP